MDFNVVKNMVEEFFNGQYEVKKFLGAGSFAEVYLVNHKYLDDLRAMKIIKEPLGSASNIKKVFHEVMLATHLRHENIISIYDAGIISTFGRDSEGRFNLKSSDDANRDDWAYFIMEYVQGGDLEQYMTSFIDSNISMPISRALDIIRQILLGLNTLHSASPKIVHRDLKPNNILLSFNSKGDIVIKISDFGFAKEVSTSDIDVEIAGNKNYMAPECYHKVFSTKTDIYAVGVIFYQILTGRCPYNINRFSLLEVLENLPWKGPLKAPSHYRREIPKYIDDVLERCLAINPSHRYADAMNLLKDVEKCINRYNKENESISHDVDEEEGYSEYIINDSIRKAFRLAKRENGLSEAIEILESEIVADYDIRKCYSSILRVWKSKRPDVKLVSQAFSVNLRGNNYKLSCNYLKEAIAYNPSIKNKYQPYIELWKIFSNLKEYGNLIKAVLSLEYLMEINGDIHDEYINVISTLKTFSAEEILNESIRLARLNSLSDAAKLMEFAVVADRKIRAQYAYKLSLLKQNMKIDFPVLNSLAGKNAINYGIDLGTTDSVISYYNDGNPIVVKNHDTGDEFTPSAVLIDEDENLQVGVKARDAIDENSDDAVSEFKNNMGFSIPFRFNRSSQVMLPEELSAEVLKDLRKSVYCELGENIEHAVITVPANSNPIKTRAVNNAAELAGFRSHYLLLEPVAVSLAYGLHECEHGKIWMIYDLGGATFNASLIKNNHGEIQKIDTVGVDTLGGNFFDWKIVEELFVPKINDDLAIEDFRRDEHRYSKEFSILKKVAERAKIELSTKDESTIFIKDFFDGYDFEYSLSVDEFREIISASIGYSLRLCRDLLESNLVSPDDISKIILVGGSSLSPVIRRMICDEFDIELEHGINPLSVVARGAAIYAGSLEKPHVEVEHGCFSVILKSHISGVTGRVFTSDSKFSFLGYEIEFISDDFKSPKIPLNVDGAFKANLKSSGEYIINVYDGEGNPVEIDVKSPRAIRFINDSYGFEMEIGFFTQRFDNSLSQDCDELISEYHRLIGELDDLTEYYSFNELNENYILEYLSRLIEILSKDKSAIHLSSVYLNYLSGRVKTLKQDLDLVMLVENIENKLAIIAENDYFSIDEISADFTRAIKNRDVDGLYEIYRLLLEKYVTLKRNDVITTCFFNLRYEGVYTKNQAFADELIKKALIALKDSDYNRLFAITNQLYQLDERNLN